MEAGGLLVCWFDHVPGRLGGFVADNFEADHGGEEGIEGGFARCFEHLERCLEVWRPAEPFESPIEAEAAEGGDFGRDEVPCEECASLFHGACSGGGKSLDGVLVSETGHGVVWLVQLFGRCFLDAQVLNQSHQQMALHPQEWLALAHVVVGPAENSNQAVKQVEGPLVLDDQFLSNDACRLAVSCCLSRRRLGGYGHDAQPEERTGLLQRCSGCCRRDINERKIPELRLEPMQRFLGFEIRQIFCIVVLECVSRAVHGPGVRHRGIFHTSSAKLLLSSATPVDEGVAAKDVCIPKSSFGRDTPEEAAAPGAGCRSDTSVSSFFSRRAVLAV